MQTHKQTALPGFRRQSQVGFNILNFDTVNQTLFLRVTEIGVFTKKDGDTVEFADVVNLESGEKHRMWLDGGLRNGLESIQKTVKLPFAIEAQWLGKAPAMVTIDGKKVEKDVNQYRMWLISEDDAKSDS